MAVPADQGARLRGAVHHIDLATFDLIVRDLAASAPFYEALLGFLAFRAAAPLARGAPTSTAPMS